MKPYKNLILFLIKEETFCYRWDLPPVGETGGAGPVPQPDPEGGGELLHGAHLGSAAAEPQPAEESARRGTEGPSLGLQVIIIVMFIIMIFILIIIIIMIVMIIIINLIIILMIIIIMIVIIIPIIIVMIIIIILIILIMIIIIIL